MTLWDWKSTFYHYRQTVFPFSLILKREIRNIEDLMAKCNLNGAPVLDVATGPGTMLEVLPAAAKVVASDRSLKMLNKVALQRAACYVAADSTHLPFKANSFKLISAVGVFEYQKHPQVFLRELHRVIMASGMLLLTYSQINFFNHLRYLWGHRLHLMTHQRMTQMLTETGYALSRMKQSLMQRQMLVAPLK